MNANSYSSPGTLGGNLDYIQRKVTMLAPEERPYTAGIASIVSTSNATYREAGLDALQPVDISGSPEGQAANQGGNKASNRTRFGVYPQRKVKHWSVTDVQEAVAKKGGNAFTGSDADYARSKCMAEMLRDIEAICLTNIADAAPSAGGEMKTRGVFNWLGGSASGVPTQYQTPSAQRQTSVATFKENDSPGMRTVLQSLATTMGKAVNVDLLLGPTYANHMDLFSGGISTDYAFRFQNFGKEDTLRRTVSQYQCTFGTVRRQLSMFLDCTAATTTGNGSAGVFFTPEHWEVDYLDPLHEVENGTNAGGEYGAYRAIFFNQCLHPQGSAFLVNSFQS
jgi:hypothetical protein